MAHLAWLPLLESRGENLGDFQIPSVALIVAQDGNSSSPSSSAAFLPLLRHAAAELFLHMNLGVGGWVGEGGREEVSEISAPH